MRATVTKIGNSTGVILPKAAADRLKVKQGDVVFFNGNADRVYGNPLRSGICRANGGSPSRLD